MDSNLSGSQSYTARDAIYLKPGFSYKATSTGSFSAKIDNQMVLPLDYYSPVSDINSIQTDKTKLVGSIAGSADVSPSGAGIYQIPIDLPPGISEVYPSISLVYNSQGGNGLAGWGFNIGGLSAITRVPKTIYTDGNPGAVTTTDQDGFALDGNRLILMSGNYGKNESVYRTEIGTTFSQITSKDATNIASGYFEVLSKDGRKCKYGSTSSGRLIYTNNNSERTIQSWMLDFVEGPNGETINYEYQEGDLYSYIKKITYANNSVEFFYSIRDDKIPQHYYNKKGEIDRVLYKIVVSSAGEVYRVYDLEYSKDTYSRLTRIKESDKYGELFNPTSFKWEAFSSQMYSNNVTIPTDNYYDRAGTSHNHSYIPADLDGDGITDLLHVFQSNYASGNFCVSHKRAEIDSNGNLNFSYFVPEPEIIPAGYIDNKNIKYLKPGATLVGDVYGTGKQNVVIPYYTKVLEVKYAQFMIFDDYSRSGFYLPLDLSSEVPAVALGDIDNNGKSDFIIIEKGKNSAGNYILKYNEVNSDYAFGWVERAITLDSNPERIITADFDSDGLLDIMVITSNSYTIFWNQGGNKQTCFSNGRYHVIKGNEINSSMKNVELGDFNGDGLIDIFYPASVASILENNGDRTFSVKEQSLIQNCLSSKGQHVLVTDINGDGKSDIIISAYFSGTAHFIRWLRSVGGNFILDKTQIINKSFSEEDRPVCADFRGKGRSSFIVKDDDWTGGSITSKWKLYSSRNNNNEGKITAIVDGLNNKTFFEYTYLSDPASGYSKNIQAYPIASIQAAFPVVKSITHQSDIEHKIRYIYKGASVHLKGRGFLCFDKIISTDLLNKIETITTNSIIDAFPVVSSQCVYTSLGENINYIGLGEEISTTINEYDVISKRGSNNIGTVIVPYLKTQTVTDKLTGLTVKTETTMDPNGYGNSSFIKTTKGDLVETQTMAYTTKNSWCPNKVQSLIEKKTLGSDSYQRTIGFEYDIKGNLVKKTLDPGDVNRIVTEYKDYTITGQPQTIETTANGIKRTVAKIYTPSGRFLVQEINELGESTSYTWDEQSGTLASQQNRLGTTRFGYNRLGQLNQTIYPDGTYRRNQIIWSDHAGKLYYSLAESSGESPIYTWYNAGGQEVLKEHYDLEERKIRIFTQYLPDGKLAKVSAPTANTVAESWEAEYSYDKYGRVDELTTPLGTTTTTYYLNTTTVSSPQGEKETTLNNAGQIESEKTNGKTVSYTYYASGKMKSATPERGSLVAMRYDLQGNRTQLTDPDAGIITSKYNGWGELIEEKQLVHNDNVEITTSYSYHPSGLLDYILRGNEKTLYEYDNLKRLKKISLIKDGVTTVSQNYTYDNWDRIIELTDHIGTNKTFVTRTEFDELGRVKKEIYPSGYFITNEYSTYGYLKGIRGANNAYIWEAKNCNPRGQLTRTKSGNKETTFGYNNKNLLETIYTPGIVDLTYSFDEKYNLSSRKDGINGYEERFLYDNLNRLKSWEILQNNNRLAIKEQKYKTGKTTIDSKTGFGTNLQYGENNNKPHALTSFIPESGIASSLPDQAISYTDFKKVKSVTENDKDLFITYGIDQQRIKSELTTSSGGLTRYYLGNYEEEVKNGITRKIHYISGGNGLAALFVQTSNASDSLYYVHTDYQGSLIALSLPDGTVKEKYAYDPWGNRRNPNNWTMTDTRTSFLIHRGYTMHEHLDDFGLINMNGRVYDPRAGMFLSPDPYIQAPGDWLNYNRYSYCMNNPLMYTDPSGELPVLAWIGIGIAASIGGYSGYKVADAKGYNFGNWQTWGYMLGGAAIGGASGYIGVSIAAGGGFMASTMGIMNSSYMNSMYMGALSGGMIHPSVSFGAASYNFGTREWGYLGKKGNKWDENLRYGLSALANLSDILMGTQPENVDLVTEHSDATGHSAIVKKGSSTATGYGNGDPTNADPNGIISVGPNRYTDPRGSWHWMKGTNKWDTHTSQGEVFWRQSLEVNMNTINKYANYLNKSEQSGRLIYSVELSSCVTHTSMALNLSGLFNIGIHPYLLNAQMYLWSNGIRPWTFNYLLDQ
ncbi:FG-GAP-like repeat-containing protein [Bacteroidales bacterium OttesenSCG-928-A17]|nr:FG-GAP-like repeat-containing protein [Bacteroidales bacterium OttesenSCG-928-A17]